MHQGFLGFGVFGTRLGSAFRVVSQKFFSVGGVCNPKPQKPQTWENTPHLTCDTFLQKKLGRSLVKFWDKLTQILSIRLGSFSFWDIIA